MWATKQRAVMTLVRMIHSAHSLGERNASGQSIYDDGGDYAMCDPDSTDDDTAHKKDDDDDDD